MKRIDIIKNQMVRVRMAENGDTEEKARERADEITEQTRLLCSTPAMRSSYDYYFVEEVTPEQAEEFADISMRARDVVNSWTPEERAEFRETKDDYINGVTKNN